MKILDSNEYINEKLDIQPVTKDRFAKFKEEPYIDEKTRKFIEDNNLIWNPVTMSYDCGGGVKASEDIVADGKLKIRFGKVDGDFNCSNNKLTSLEGVPKYVGGYFDCGDNNLTTLEGVPKEVGGYFDCSYNNLTTLEGAPNVVGEDFYCDNNRLTTLEGAPNEVSGDFFCGGNKLATLEGAPKEVGGCFSCSNNNLTTLEGAPKKVGGYFNCRDNQNLVLPEEKPIWVKGEIYK